MIFVPTALKLLGYALMRRLPSRLGPGHGPHAILIAPILLKLSAMQTSLNSALAFSNPRMLNCRNPSTFLIQPLGGSAIHLRFL